MGCDAELSFVYRFTYHAKYLDIGSEHELCSVYVGVTDDVIVPNSREIDDYKWVDYERLDQWFAAEPALFTPWFKMEWATLRGTTMANALSVLGDANPASIATN